MAARNFSGAFSRTPQEEERAWSARVPCATIRASVHGVGTSQPNSPIYRELSAAGGGSAGQRAGSLKPPSRFNPRFRAEDGMNNQLRPLTLGELLDRTVELYRRNFLLFLGISAIFAGAMLAIQLLYTWSLVRLGYPNMTHWQWTTAVAAVVEALAVLLLGGLSIAPNNRAVAWVYLDQPASISAAIQSMFPRIGRYTWLMTLVGVLAWGPLIVIYIAFFGVMFSVLPHDFLTNPAAMQNPPNLSPVEAIHMLLAVLVLTPLLAGATIYGVLMSLRYSLSVPASVVESLPARAAIRRSIDLSKGSRGRIFVLGLLVGVVKSLITYLFSIPIFYFAFRHLGQPMPLGWLIFQQCGIFLTDAFIGPIYATGLTLFYYDQRIRKEGFDIEWMMQAAGLVPQQHELAAGNPGSGAVT